MTVWTERTQTINLDDIAILESDFKQTNHIWYFHTFEKQDHQIQQPNHRQEQIQEIWKGLSINYTTRQWQYRTTWKRMEYKKDRSISEEDKEL
jgi:hypothetical protein